MKKPKKGASASFKNQPQLYLNEQEVAEKFSLSISFLQKARHYRTGPPYHKIGRSVRYHLPDLISYFESKRIEPDSGCLVPEQEGED